MKKILMLLAVAGLTTAAFAQENKKDCDKPCQKEQVSTNKFWSNWFISGGVGGEFLIGNNDAHYSIGDRISPTFNVSVGKWLAPQFGLRLQYSGFEGKGASKGWSEFSTGKPDAWDYYDQKFHYMNLHLDMMFNLNAIFAGYNPNRVYEVVPYLGLGFAHSFSGTRNSEIVGRRQTMTANFGIINKFRLSNAIDLNLELSSMMTEDEFDREIGGKKDFDGTLAATIGITYHFKNRGFAKVQPKMCEPELRDLRNRINNLEEEQQRMKNAMGKAPAVVVKEVPADCPDPSPYTVFFAIGSSKITNQEAYNINTIGEQMKNDPQLKANIVGYADSATGTSNGNDVLSQQRAKAVAEYLKANYGITESRISTESRGGVDKLNPIYLNRQARIELTK